MKRIAAIALAMVLVSAGCGRDQGSRETQAPPEEPDEYHSYFVGWLKRHGEQGILVSREGVSVEGRPVRFSAKTYGTDTVGDGCSIEVEFTTVLPDKRTITDYVVGVGADPKAATGDALANFTLTTFHVLYSAFINSQDPHLRPQTHDVGGRPRSFHIGAWGIRSQSPLEPGTLDGLTKYIVARIGETDLDERAHWVKIVYGQNKGKAIMSETTLDNGNDEPLDVAIDGAPWPKREDFYMLKLFILIR